MQFSLFVPRAVEPLAGMCKRPQALPPNLELTTWQLLEDGRTAWLDRNENERRRRHAHPTHAQMGGKGGGAGRRKSVTACNTD